MSRAGADAATAWATYSTVLGSPVGDTTGGVFRFTCSTANAPCTVAVKAAVLSDSAGTTAIYPRVLIYRQDYNAGGPEVYCEYGDGSTGSLPLAITQQALSSTPAYTAVPLNIGGTADCVPTVSAPGGDVDSDHGSVRLLRRALHLYVPALGGAAAGQVPVPRVPGRRNAAR